MRKRWITALALLLCAKTAFAQTVRGSVVAAGDRPVSGVVVALVDAGAKEVARALTNERGEYRLTAPRPGTYRLRTLRIGFQSHVTEPFALVEGDDLSRRLAVSTVVFTLDTVRATGRNTCKVIAADSTSVVVSIWDQVRSALIATQLTLATRTIFSTTLSYQRMLDARSQRIGSQSLDARADFVRQPWRSLSVDSLRKVGYVYDLGDSDSSRVYNAPDMTVLLSDEFVEDHCFRLSSSSSDKRLGVEFEPTSARRRIPEIRGTLWLDRGTNELIEMEYGYINRIRSDEERLAGGRIGFTRMRNGMWAISGWSIRMPVRAARPVYGPNLRILRHDIVIDSLMVTGGELVLATTTGTRRDTIWMRPPITLRGTVVDSLSGAPVRRAIVSLSGTIQLDTTDAAGQFSIGGVLPGRYSLNVTTPSLDSVNTMIQRSVIFADSSLAVTVRVPDATLMVGSVCGPSNAATRLGAGIVLGTVVKLVPNAAGERDSVPVANAEVSAQWKDLLITSTGTSFRVREAQTRTDARGVFRMCGLPTSTVFDFFAKTADGEANPVRVEVASNQLFARADLVVDKPRQRFSVFTGMVVDTAGKPVVAAEVLFPALGLAALADATGAFRVRDVPPGEHAITVRRIGYGPVDTRLAFVAGTPTDRRIVMTRITLLDSVVTTAGSFRDPNMDEFEERRRIGRGHFITRADLARREGMTTGTFLQQMPNINMHTAVGGEYVIGRGPRCADKPPATYPLTSGVLCTVYYVPSASEHAQGVPIGCFAKVYVDNALANPGTPTPPFNLREMPPTQIEAMELYVRPAEVPPKYANLNSGCGVLIVHTRRFRGK